MVGLFTILGAVFLISILMIYSSLSWGLVLLKFYSWFVLPIFTTLPVITYWQAVGLMLFISLFCRYAGEGIKDEYKDSIKMLAISLIGPWTTLFFGWLINILFVV